MKKIVFLLLVVGMAYGAKAQNTGICLRPSCPVTIQLPVDSAMIYASLQLTGDTVTGISWVAASVGTFAIPGSNITEVRGLTTPGTYTYTCTLTTKHGSVLSTEAVVTVLAAPVVQIPQRSVVSIAVSINGVLVTIPVKGSTITYTDGTIQSN